ncbi:MAG: type II toxin-antitoxin system Phd/YefM family antitoxin [Nitrospira sp.]|nr:type II toxin-antitoxin system Phd/YefM family antitoxin [bacterium]MBL7032111.1 type II toxin-antitoxin system Phd/YefM family antitoxin [Nitrospira sp.]
MKTIGATQFKQQCLSILDRVDKEGIVITKHGRPVAKLVPVESSTLQLIGSMKGTIKIKGDIISTGLTWNAES